MQKKSRWQATNKLFSLIMFAVYISTFEDVKITRSATDSRVSLCWRATARSNDSRSHWPCIFSLRRDQTHLFDLDRKHENFVRLCILKMVILRNLFRLLLALLQFYAPVMPTYNLQVNHNYILVTYRYFPLFWKYLRFLRFTFDESYVWTKGY